MNDPSNGCGRTMGHGESCTSGYLCDACRALATGQLWSVKIPCGRTVGHGECCSEGWLCEACTRVARARGGVQ